MTLISTLLHADPNLSEAFKEALNRAAEKASGRRFTDAPVSAFDVMPPSTYTGPERRIVTTWLYPPIPLREFDWRATFGDYEPGGLIGYGRTRAAAVKDLQDQAETMADEWHGGTAESRMQEVRDEIEWDDQRKGIK